MMNKEDEDIISQFQSGDTEALKELFERYKRPIFNFCLKLTNNRADAEDVTAEVFLKLFKKQYAPQSGVKFSTWLYTIARNDCISRLRKRKYSIPLWFTSSSGEEEAWEIEDTKENHSQTLMNEEMKKKVRQAIFNLDLEQRQAIILREYQHCRYDEIAQVMGCSLEKVKILLHRARQRLKGELASFVEGGE